MLTKKNKLKQTYSKTIIVPAKNEEKNIEPLIERIPIFNSEYEIIIICGQSKDNTLSASLNVKEKFSNLPIRVIEQHSKGKGPGVLEAIKESRYELITVLDSDLSVDPETLSDFLKSLKKVGLIL